MKVLEKGSGWSLEVVCTGGGNGDGGCRSKLLLEKSDLFRTSNTTRDETDHFTTFKCVECGVLTDVPDKLVPYGMRNNMPDRRAWELARSGEDH